MPNISDTDGFGKYLGVLKENLQYVEDDTFSWGDTLALLIIKLRNTDSLNKARNESNATQIQLTSERDASEGKRKTEDFFPTLTLNTTFKSWRLSVPARMSTLNIAVLKDEATGESGKWVSDTIQIRRRLLNADSSGGGNPAIHICYGNDLMPLREVLQVDDYLVIVKRKNESVYEAFGVRGNVDLGNGKQMYISDKASQDSTTFSLNDITPSDAEASDETKALCFKTGCKSKFSRNRIIFGAPGTGKSYTVNSDRKELLGENNEVDYERVTFHPDYSYANFVGTYKPVMMVKKEKPLDKDTDYVVSVLNDKGKTAQEKYDILFERFKDEGLTRLPVLLGLYTDELFKTRKQDGSDAAGDNSVERNHGRAIRKYVSLLTGQEITSDLAYEYVSGPFMRVYVNALKSAKAGDQRPHLLIVEEINRANVAAVFGDIFQLLDRDDEGVSEYPIQATEDIKNYLAKELGGDPDDYSKIRIPDNMFIWATMNSADQGVFPMDTAFKRRWDFTYLGIDDSDKDIRGKFVTVGSKEKQRIEWNELRKAINEFLADEKINEDKQLGPYFISRSIVVPVSGNEIDSKRFCDVFKHKVLMYLFDDAAKQKRAKLFEGSAKGQARYSKICEAFDEQGIGIFHADIQNRVKIQDLVINEHEVDENGMIKTEADTESEE